MNKLMQNQMGEDALASKIERFFRRNDKSFIDSSAKAQAKADLKFIFGLTPTRFQKGE